MNKVIGIRKRIEGKKKASKYDEPIEIVDRREHGYFIIDDIFLDEYARICGVYVGAVYMSLCRHVNKERMCWPSVRRISDQWGMTPRSVISGLRWLEEHKLIKMYREKGRSTIYELLDKKKWWKNIRVVDMIRPATWQEMRRDSVNGS